MSATPTDRSTTARVVYLHYADPGFITRYRQWIKTMTSLLPPEALRVEIVTMDQPEPPLSEVVAGLEAFDFLLFDPVLTAPKQHDRKSSEERVS